MRGQAHEDIGLANIDELAEKIVGEKVSVFHFKIPFDFGTLRVFGLFSSFLLA
jgi:hypothetical protein